MRVLRMRGIPVPAGGFGKGREWPPIRSAVVIFIDLLRRAARRRS